MPMELAIGVLLCTIVLSRLLSERALRRLSQDQKASLLDAFSGLRAYSAIPVVVLVVAFLGLGRSGIVPVRPLFTGYGVAVLAYLAGMFWYTRRKLATLELPQEYLQQFWIARSLSLVGVVVFLAAFAGRPA